MWRVLGGDWWVLVVWSQPFWSRVPPRLARWVHRATDAHLLTPQLAAYATPAGVTSRPVDAKRDFSGNRPTSKKNLEKKFQTFFLVANPDGQERQPACLALESADVRTSRVDLAFSHHAPSGVGRVCVSFDSADLHLHH